MAPAEPKLSSRDGLRTVGTLLLLSRTLDAAVRQRSSDDLSIAELSVLGQIDRGTDLPSAIARALRLDPARITRLSDRLVTLGLIDRSTDPSDRRRCVLSLTQSGYMRLEEGRATLVEALEHVLNGLGDTERDGLVRGLEAARRVIEPTPTAAPAPAVATVSDKF